VMTPEFREQKKQQRTGEISIHHSCRPPAPRGAPRGPSARQREGRGWGRVARAASRHGAHRAPPPASRAVGWGLRPAARPPAWGRAELAPPLPEVLEPITPAAPGDVCRTLPTISPDADPVFRRIAQHGSNSVGLFQWNFEHRTAEHSSVEFPPSSLGYGIQRRIGGDPTRGAGGASRRRGAPVAGPPHTPARREGGWFTVGNGLPATTQGCGV